MALAALVALPFVANAIGDASITTLATRIVILSIAAASLNLALGYGGMVSFGHAAYFGVNYYIYGHKLKLMAGTEYHHMDGGGDGGDFDGWTSTVGLRMSF